MKLKVIIAISVFAVGLFCSSGKAQTNDVYPILKTLDGATYTNAEISSVTAAYAIVIYGGGGTKIPLTNLPPELQKKYHYDPAAAAAFDKAQADKKAKYQADRLAALAAQAEANKDRLYRFVDGELVPISQFVQLRGKISQVLTDGIRLNMDPYMISGDPRIVFVKCPVHGLIDNQMWRGYAYHTGAYKYEAVSGASITIPEYNTGLSYLTKSDNVLEELPRRWP
jgi:hypothetical protein